jgi:hypothetical protein
MTSIFWRRSNRANGGSTADLAWMKTATFQGSASCRTMNDEQYLDMK